MEGNEPDQLDPAREAVPLWRMVQVWAWLDATRPEDSRRWEGRLNAAELDGDEDACRRMEHDMAALWVEHRDDPLPEYDRVQAELAQVDAWLRMPRLDMRWRRAHGLAVTTDEWTGDVDRMLGLWRQHRDDPEAPPEVAEFVTGLVETREARLDQAAAWVHAHEPEEYRNWQLCRDFADSLAETASDDAGLIRHWLTRPPTPSRPAETPPGASAPEQSRRSTGWGFRLRRRPQQDRPDRADPWQAPASPRRNDSGRGLGL